MHQSFRNDTYIPQSKCLKSKLIPERGANMLYWPNAVSHQVICLARLWQHPKDILRDCPDQWRGRAPRSTEDSNSGASPTTPSDRNTACRFLLPRHVFILVAMVMLWGYASSSWWLVHWYWQLFHFNHECIVETVFS